MAGIDARGGRIEAVRVRKVAPGAPTGSGELHTIRTRNVVNAAGAWSPEIAKMLGEGRSPTRAAELRGRRGAVLRSSR